MLSLRPSRQRRRAGERENRGVARQASADYELSDRFPVPSNDAETTRMGPAPFASLVGERAAAPPFSLRCTDPPPRSGRTGR